jgi:hypothetical protein
MAVKYDIHISVGRVVTVEADDDIEATRLAMQEIPHGWSFLMAEVEERVEARKD